MENVLRELGSWGTHGVWVLIVACATAVLLTAILTAHRRKSQRDEMDITLKLEMVQRGMSADEIERILRARSDSAESHPAVR